jgi:hypothetical protein
VTPPRQRPAAAPGAAGAPGFAVHSNLNRLVTCAPPPFSKSPSAADGAVLGVCPGFVGCNKNLPETGNFHYLRLNQIRLNDETFAAFNLPLLSFISEPCCTYSYVSEKIVKYSLIYTVQLHLVHILYVFTYVYVLSVLVRICMNINVCLLEIHTYTYIYVQYVHTLIYIHKDTNMYI